MIAGDVQYSTMFVELDCLLDTRLALLFQMCPDKIAGLLDSGYIDRDQDVFPDVDMKQFKKLYRRRDKSLLKNAVVTPVKRLMLEFATETQHNSISTPFKMLPKLVINSYPYVLSDEEAGVIITAVIASTYEKADVSMVYIPMEEITPSYVKQNLSLLVMYDHQAWLEHHASAGNFTNVICPEVGMMGPALYQHSQPTAKDHAKAKELGTTLHGAFEKTAAPFIALKVMPTRCFSVALGIKPETEEPPSVEPDDPPEWSQFSGDDDPRFA